MYTPMFNYILVLFIYFNNYRNLLLKLFPLQRKTLCPLKRLMALLPLQRRSLLAAAAAAAQRMIPRILMRCANILPQYVVHLISYFD